MINNHFSKLEQQCELTFRHGGPYWHLCTPGQLTEILCENDDDYKFYMNLTAVCSAQFEIGIITFQVMSNHFHFLLEAPENDCMNFFSKFKHRMLRYYPREGRHKNLVLFNAKLFPIDNLESMRNEIAYINRNGYLADNRYTPFSYPWGAGYAYYNYAAGLGGLQAFSSLSDREKKALCKSRLLDLPRDCRIRDGIIVPESFCQINKGEAFFRNASHYFTKISKNYEAYSAVARSLGEETVLSDDEMFSMVSAKAGREHGETRPSRLPQKVKLDYARMMRREYFASDGQIRRILALDKTLVSELFGH